MVNLKIPMIRCKHCGTGYVAISFPFLAKYVRIWDDWVRQALLNCTLGLSLRRQSKRFLETRLVPLSLHTINQRVNVIVRALPPLAGEPLSDVPPLVQFDGI